MLRKKEQSKNKSPMGLIRGELVTNQHEHLTEELLEQETDDDFKPFISQFFFFFLNGSEVEWVPITILRDTGAKNSLARHGVVPFSDRTYCGSDILVWAVGLYDLCVPLHTVTLTSPLESGTVQVGV